MSTTNDANADQITNLYQALLGRSPDQAGLQFWDDTGLSTQAIQAEFLRSPEYRTKSIDDLYGNVLGREPDAGGLDYWNQTGLDTSQIQSEMLKSPEYKSSVQGLYSDVFGRQPDSTGLNYWQNSGLGVPQIKQEFMQSPEYSAGVSNLYRSVLDRQPDASGQMFWQTSGLGLPDMAQQFMNSPEYIKDSGYESNLIASLRAANKDPMTNNPGVTLLDNPKNSTLTLNFNKPVPTGLSNRPEKLKITPTTPTPYNPDTTGGGGGGGGGGNGGGGGPIVIGPGGGGGGGGGIVIGPGGGNDTVVDDDKDTDGLDDLIDSLTGGDQDTSTGGNDTVVGDDDKDTDGLDDLIDSLTGGNQDTSTGGNDGLNADDTVDTTDYYDANADEIAQLYRDIFGREPDEGGLEFWDETGLSADDIAEWFRSSDEYASLNDAGDIPDYTNDLWGDDTGGDNTGGDNTGGSDIVDTFDPVEDVTTDDADADAIAQLYRDILGREPDEGGLDFWDQTGLSADDIAEWFRGSDEYASMNADPDVPDYTNDLYGDDTGVNTDVGIDLGQADDLGGLLEMYDPLDGSSPIVFDLKGEDYGTNFGSDWLMDALFGGDFSGGGGGGGGTNSLLHAIALE